MCGRGLLEKYGPNHLGVPIITRVARDEEDGPLLLDGRFILEVLMDCTGKTWKPPVLEGAFDSLPTDEVRRRDKRWGHKSGSTSSYKAFSIETEI